MIVATDHTHYVSQDSYSNKTKDFDFRHGSKYVAGTTLKYATSKPYGPEIILQNSYSFNWQMIGNDNKIHFLFLEVL